MFGPILQLTALLSCAAAVIMSVTLKSCIKRVIRDSQATHRTAGFAPVQKIETIFVALELRPRLPPGFVLVCKI